MSYAPVPEFGWKARGNRPVPDRRRPFQRPSVRQSLEVLPCAYRYLKYWLRHYSDRHNLFINTIQPLTHNIHTGVPCGGIGCGAIGTDIRGDFCKFSLRPGVVEQKCSTVKGDHFIVTIRRRGVTVYQSVLGAAKHRSALSRTALRAWQHTFPPEHIQYTGLYPRAWTEYTIPQFSLKLTRRQISPIIPHDYQESSLPITVFVWSIEHLGANIEPEPLDVCITFTWREGTGTEPSTTKHHQHEHQSGSAVCGCCGCMRHRHKNSTNGSHSDSGSVSSVEHVHECTHNGCSAALFDGSHTATQGVMLEHSIGCMPCTFAIAALPGNNQRVTRCLQFDPNGSGRQLWEDLYENGVVSLTYDGASGQSVVREHLGMALSVQCRVQPNSVEYVHMALVWDMPVVHFGHALRAYKRRYTRFFSSSSQSVADQLCEHGLQQYAGWEQRINEWQRPLLVHPCVPAWYKSALFNELYYISDGGTVWLEYDSEWTSQALPPSKYSQNVFEQWGRFAYLESWEYRMFNTYDVHFYASFALAHLWPHLEHSIQTDFCDQVAHVIPERAKYHFDGDHSALLALNRVPHDLGNPHEEPWLRPNAYLIHNTAEWKDLNLKFVLTCYRDYLHVVDDADAFLDHCYPTMKAIMHLAVDRWDTDHDGMIENSGTADQTYDAWKMSGVSAYCGCLWLAAVAVYTQMSQLVGERDEAKLFGDLLLAAQERYQVKLWTGSYYKFDEHSTYSHDSVMSDQLCGLWYLSMADSLMAKQLLPNEHVLSALSTIFRLNVMRFAGGKMGAVNGMRPTGKPDQSLQANEMWTGTSYALASLLLHKGLARQGWHTARGVYDTVYNQTGLQYQTPEALYERGYYRAIGYMRPLAIWAMQWTLHTHFAFPHLPQATFNAINGAEHSSVTSNLSALVFEPSEDKLTMTD